MRIDIGMRVRTEDRLEIGTVTQVISNPSTGEIDSLVVHGDPDMGRDILVPLSLVEGETGGVLQLRVDRGELSVLPDFVRGRPDRQWEAPASDIGITEGTRVFSVDGPIGVVDKVYTDPLADRATTIVVRKGIGLTRDVEIPMELVASVGQDGVRLSLTTQQVEELPQPITDRYIVVERQEGGQE